jgi:hypothetical protein
MEKIAHLHDTEDTRYIYDDHHQRRRQRRYRPFLPTAINVLLREDSVMLMGLAEVQAEVQADNLQSYLYPW